MKSCYHCSEKCEDTILFDEKVFCCEGCKTVYDILSTNNMGEYYLLNAQPGIKRKRTEARYDFLELDEVQKNLLLFAEGNRARVKLFLPQIHCSSCLWLLEQLHRFHEGVISSQIDFAKKEAEISFNSDLISLRELAELLWSIGYAPDINLTTEDGPKKQKVNRRLVKQIGLAGFCFGNIMLFSFPEYLGLDEQFSDFQSTFNYLNLLLSIPVLIFGASDYIISSFKAIKHQHINIDVPIALGIFALYFRSVFEVVSGTGAGYFDSFAGLIFFLLVGKWFQQRTYAAINFERDYKSYFPIATTKINSDKQEEIIQLKDVEVGDELLIRNHELIPADAILKSDEARIDYSFVTGESTPVKKLRGDQIFAGGRQIGTAVSLTVEKPVNNSYLTSLWNNPIFHKAKTHSRFSDTVSKYFTIAIILIAMVAAVYWWVHEPSKIAFVITSVLIVACPCAIALSTPFTQGSMLRALSKKAYFLRSGDVLEPLADVTDIVFDKTGTMTHAENYQLSWEGVQLTNEQKNTIAAICRQSNHPLSKSIVKHLNQKGEFPELVDFKEIAGKGLGAKVNDDEWKIGSGSWLNVHSSSTQSRVHIQKGDTYLGCFVFENEYRAGIFELIEALKPNWKIHLLSGDQDAERNRLTEEIGSDARLNFNQSPEDKLNYIADLQSKGAKVLMVGDGLNDAGALQQADVGIAVVDDVYAFSPSSDIIASAKALPKLNRVISLAKSSRKIIAISYGFSILYNSVGLYFALSGQLTPLIAAILMPLSSISVVLLVTALSNVKASKIQ